MEFKLPYYNPPPLPPSSSSSSSSCYNYKRKCYNGISFSSSILQYGYYRDTSIQNTTKIKKNKQIYIQNKKNKMDRLTNEFQKEVNKVKELQLKLAQNQQQMAEIAYQLYSITFIQSIYRGWRARVMLKRLFLKRFLRIFITFRRKLKKARKSQKCIVHNFRQFMIRKKLFQTIRFCCAIIKIQRLVRKRLLKKRAIIRVQAYKLWNHYKLFGITKVIKKVCPLEKYRYILNSFIGSYIRRKRLQRLENRLNCFKIFYSLLFLQYNCREHLINYHKQTQKYTNEFNSTNEWINQMQLKYHLKILIQSRNELLTFIKSKMNDVSQGRKKSIIDSFSREVKVNLNKSYHSTLDTISLLHNEVTDVLLSKSTKSSTILSYMLPSPFILCNNYRLRSIRETVQFLFDLKKQGNLFPDLLDPTQLNYVGFSSSPKSKKLSIDLSNNRNILKLIPPSIQPFENVIFESENQPKKDQEKSSGLRKINQIRLISKKGSGKVTTILPKPPQIAKTTSKGRLIPNKVVIKASSNDSISLIPSNKLNLPNLIDQNNSKSLLTSTNTHNNNNTNSTNLIEIKEDDSLLLKTHSSLTISNESELDLHDDNYNDNDNDYPDDFESSSFDSINITPSSSIPKLNLPATLTTSLNSKVHDDINNLHNIKPTRPNLPPPSNRRQGVVSSNNITFQETF